MLFSNVFLLHFLQGLESDFLRLVDRSSLDGLELVHEFALEGLVVAIRPFPVFFQGLGNADLEIEASTAHLSGNLGTGKFLEFGQIFVQ